MNVIATMLQTLNTPDSFNENWYAWATRQLSHIGLGITFCGLFGVIGLPLWVAATLSSILGLAKEAFDFAITPTWQTAYFKIENLVYEGLGISLGWALVAQQAFHYVLAFALAVVMLFGGAVTHIIRQHFSSQN